jgi:molecular chaperone HscB
MQARCPACARLQEPRLFCSDCGAPLAVELDYFAALGLPRRLTLDPAQLETLYHDLGRRFHPDRFANQPAPVRHASLVATARLTRAFRTLRDAVSRGLYWLELNGEKLARDNQQVPPELAELIFEVQESLSELQASQSGANHGEDLKKQVLSAKSDVQNLLKNAFAQLDHNYADWDNLVNHRADLIVQLKSILSRIAYLRTLDRDIGRVMEQHDLK